MEGYARKNFFELLDSGCLILAADLIDVGTIYFFTPQGKIKSAMKESRDRSLGFLETFDSLAWELKLPINNPFAFYHAAYVRADGFLEKDELKNKVRTVLKLAYQDYKFLFGSSFEDTDWQRAVFRLADWRALPGEKTQETDAEEVSNQANEQLADENQETGDEAVSAHANEQPPDKEQGAGDEAFSNQANEQTADKKQEIEEAYLHTICVQNQLNGAIYFEQNHDFLEKSFSDLKKKVDAYKKWLTESPEQTHPRHRSLFDLSRFEIKLLCQVYSEFFVRQDNRSFVNGSADASEADKSTERTKNTDGNFDEPTKVQKQAAEDLIVCIQTAADIVRLLSDIQTTRDTRKERNGEKDKKEYEQKLLLCSQKISKYGQDHQSEIRCLERHAEEEEGSLSQILEAFNSMHGNDAKRKIYINNLKEYPIVYAIYSIAIELGKTHIQEIAAYYLFTLLNHTQEDIFAPFKKKKYKWEDNDAKMKDGVMSADPTAIKGQKNAIFLFNALSEITDLLQSFSKCNRDLCEFLFERCRDYAPHYCIVPAFGQTQTSNMDLTRVHNCCVRQYPLQCSIDYSVRRNSQINVMNFQQYAKTQCTAEDFYSFYFRPTAEQKKVLRKIKKLLTPEIIQQYARIALYPEGGYGTSRQTEKWHKQMAEFLDRIIDSDEVITDYVDGRSMDEEDWDKIDMGDGNATFAMWRDLFSYGDPADPKSAEREENKSQVKEHLTNHAQVQLAIHKICSERMIDKTVKMALSLYKKFFFEI